MQKRTVSIAKEGRHYDFLITDEKGNVLAERLHGAEIEVINAPEAIKQLVSHIANASKNPFELFTPAQKAIFYKASICYQQQLRQIANHLSNQPAITDDMNLQLDILEFQMDQVKEMDLLFQQAIDPQELNILPLVNDYVVQRDAELAKLNPIGAHC